MSSPLRPLLKSLRLAAGKSSWWQITVDEPIHAYCIRWPFPGRDFPENVIMGKKVTGRKTTSKIGDTYRDYISFSHDTLHSVLQTLIESHHAITQSVNRS
jgi:hypothetical protein